MGLKIDPGNEPGPVDTTNPRAQKALEELYGERFGKQGGVRAIKAEYAKTKDAGQPLHAAMLERLTLQIPVTEAELQRLAQARGEAVKQTLITLGQVDGAKIGVSEAVKSADGGKLAASKLNLQAGKKPAPAPASPAAPAPSAPP